MSTTVYLADLRYNYSGFLANDCMPLGVSYMKAHMDRAMPEVNSRLFAYPDKLWDAIVDNPPDVLMVTNYVWNEALSLHFGKLAKKVRPETLVVMGGPNISLEPERQTEYLRQHPEIDLYALGEGDILAGEIVQHFLDSGKSLQKMGARDIPSSVYRRPDGQPVRQESWERHQEIDEIPSPWLTGVLDEFFDGKLAPLLETNRGCPFTCTFCVQGIRWYTKVHNFTKERIREEVEYIARRVHDVCPQMGTLRIADSNYGMFERDIEISGYLGEMQKKYGYPGYIDATTGKNRADRIIQSVEKVNGALVVYQAVQSLDENVLRNVKRQTIKLKAYEDILIHIRGRGLRSNSDLILGLPGDSLKTHVDGLHKLLDGGVSQVTNFQLMMLKGSELETLESRQQFSFETRFRVLPKNYGIYGGEKVFDIEEIVIASDTLSFQDYLEARKYALVSVAFWHNSDLDDALDFAEKRGVKRSLWLDRVLDYMERSTGPLNEFLQNFVNETTNELFPSREACASYYSDDVNFQRLVAGEVGENLMHKHNALSSFYFWPHICKAGMDVTRDLLVEQGASAEIADFEEFWQDFHTYLEARHAWGNTSEQILAPVNATLRYDVRAWLENGSPIDTSPYRLERPEEFHFQLPEDSARSLAGSLDVWTTNIRGLTKLVTRIQVAWQTRVATRVAADANVAAQFASA
ncbi:MAG: cobalamin B12-binding domain-containing protein [Bryobacteraceae bacterium]|nr:cobalamin B12-binding domain-containing protein [Bryobacteraceae bacterium]